MLNIKKNNFIIIIRSANFITKILFQYFSNEYKTKLLCQLQSLKKQHKTDYFSIWTQSSFKINTKKNIFASTASKISLIAQSFSTVIRYYIILSAPRKRNGKVWHIKKKHTYTRTFETKVLDDIFQEVALKF